MPVTPKVSVVVPVLRWAETLENTLAKLVADGYPSKQIVVVADSPTQALREVMAKFANEITFSAKEERRGKVNALKEAYDLCTGDVIVFLDSDIVIRTPNLISKTMAEMKGYDMLEMKKTIYNGGLLPSLVYFEYVGFNAANWVLFKKMNKTLGVNGAGFAITREAYERIGGFQNVVSEDLDLGLRGYLRDLRFRYADDIEVGTFAPSDMKSWWKQRKRWSYGAALWLRDNRKEIFSALRRHPGILLTALLMIFPTVLSVLFSLTFKELATFDILALAMISLSSKSFPLIIPPLLPLEAMPNLVGMGMAVLVGLVGYGAMYLAFSWKLGYRFRPVQFVLYYLVYSPVWLAAMVWGLVTVFVKREKVEIDWKV